MIAPTDEQLPNSFALAKWLAMTAVAMTPLLLVVATFKQSASMMLIAISSLFFVPVVAGAGYGVGRLLRLMALHDQEDARTFFPADWPLPFRLFNAIHGTRNHPRHTAFRSAFISIFVVTWCCFALICVSTGIVLLTVQP